jgi:hypothetical protein
MGFLTKILNKIRNISNPSEKVTWQSIEYFDIFWKNRIAEMASLIPHNTKSIVDLGCGKMWLKEFVGADIKYYGVDYTYRDEHTFICDFNAQEYPNIQADCYFLSGIVEYIEDTPSFFQNIGQFTNTIILSYCSTDNVKNRQPFWVNHFSRKKIIISLDRVDFKLIKLVENFHSNDIFLFQKIEK